MNISGDLRKDGKMVRAGIVGIMKERTSGTKTAEGSFSLSADQVVLPGDYELTLDDGRVLRILIEGGTSSRSQADMKFTVMGR